MAFPGIIRAMSMIHWVTFLLMMVRPEIAESLSPAGPGALENGEYWRLISGVLLPPVYPMGSNGFVFSAFFMLIATRIAFLFSDGLEDSWGSLRTSIYLYACIFCQSLILFFIPIPIFGSELLYLAILFAFATWFPDFEFLLMFVFPVKLKFLAPLSAFFLFRPVLSMPSLLPVFLLFHAVAFAPYLIWVFLRFRGGSKHPRPGRKKRPSKMDLPSLHRCALCNRTEASDPDLSFRVAADDEEYCLDHLPDADKSPVP